MGSGGDTFLSAFLCNHATRKGQSGYIRNAKKRSDRAYLVGLLCSMGYVPGFFSSSAFITSSQ